MIRLHHVLLLGRERFNSDNSHHDVFFFTLGASSAEEQTALTRYVRDAYSKLLFFYFTQMNLTYTLLRKYKHKSTSESRKVGLLTCHRIIVPFSIKQTLNISKHNVFISFKICPLPWYNSTEKFERNYMKMCVFCFSELDRVEQLNCIPE